MTTRKGQMLALVVTVLGITAVAAEKVGVGGSSVQYDARIEATVGDKAVPMTLTGAALRKRVLFSVYTVGSYLQEGAGARSAEELAGADVPKQLHLVMERDLEGKEIAEAFRTAIRANYAEPTYGNELASLSEMMRGLTVKKGDHVRLTHVPKSGLHCDIAGRKQFAIQSTGFSKAVWEIYLGRNNLGADIKKALVSRL